MPAFSAKKSFKDGHVKVRVEIKSDGWRGDSVNVQGSTDLSSSAARDLAQALLAEADRADAKVASKEASEARRRKWRDQEVAAGRMKIFGTT